MIYLDINVLIRFGLVRTEHERPLMPVEDSINQNQQRDCSSEGSHARSTAEPGPFTAEVARALDVNPNVVHQWHREYLQQSGKCIRAASRSEDGQQFPPFCRALSTDRTLGENELVAL
jgi:hypothetical protein